MVTFHIYTEEDPCIYFETPTLTVISHRGKREIGHPSNPLNPDVLRPSGGIAYDGQESQVGLDSR